MCSNSTAGEGIACGLQQIACGLQQNRDRLWVRGELKSSCSGCSAEHPEQEPHSILSRSAGALRFLRAGNKCCHATAAAWLRPGMTSKAEKLCFVVSGLRVTTVTPRWRARKLAETSWQNRAGRTVLLSTLAGRNACSQPRRFRSQDLLNTDQPRMTGATQRVALAS